MGRGRVFVVPGSWPAENHASHPDRGPDGGALTAAASPAAGRSVSGTSLPQLSSLAQNAGSSSSSELSARPRRASAGTAADALTAATVNMCGAYQQLRTANRRSWRTQLFAQMSDFRSEKCVRELEKPATSTRVRDVCVLLAGTKERSKVPNVCFLLHRCYLHRERVNQSFKII